MRANLKKDLPEENDRQINITNIKNQKNTSKIETEINKQEETKSISQDVNTQDKDNFVTNQQYKKPPLPRQNNLSLDRIRFTPEEKSFDLMRSFNSDQLINEESYCNNGMNCEDNEESSNIINCTKLN